MNDYISRKALLDWVHEFYPEDKVFASAILNAPAADVAPVRHGRWIERKSFHAEGGIVAKCSACQKDVQYLGNPLNFCPNCGAKMDGGNVV